MTTLSIPENSPNDTVFQSYKDGKEAGSFTNNEITKYADSLWSDHFSKSGSKPVFMSIDLETPLALASFIANNSNLHKVFIPATFNMSKILKNLKNQESTFVVCDQEFYELKPPGNRADEYKEMA